MISEFVIESAAEPALGLLVAAGPRAARSPAEYALLFETIREGYLLHYGEPRLLAGHDPDLALLAGDYLYALGLERLAALGDTEAVGELGDLISLAAQCHAEGREGLSAPLWLSSATAIGCGSAEAHAEAKEAARRAEPGAAALLVRGARETATTAGAAGALGRAAEAIDFALAEYADRG